MLEYLRNSKIMIVVAHPDDELIGLGATMNKLINEYNACIHVVILGEGITSRSKTRNRSSWEKELKIHKQNIEKARLSIGFHSVSTYDFPDNRFDSVPLLDIIKVIESEKQKFNPETIFTHHGGDLNIDHQKTFQAVLTACRPIADECVKNIITFETFSGTEWRPNSDPHHFLPNFYVEINEENLNAKINGMQAYEFESRLYPHPRSPEAFEIVAKRTGIIIGKQLAEAFQIIRSIN